MVKDELDILRRMFAKYDYKTFSTGSPLEQLDCLNKGAEFAQTTKETENYKSGEAKAVLTVNPGDPGIGAVTAGVVNDTLETSAIVLTRENTDVNGNLTVEAGQTLAWGDNTIRYTFTPNDTTNYKVVKGEVTVSVVDTIAPVGTVSIDDNKWNDLWNTITFGLFFKETKTVKVAAEDVLSGIAKVEYYDSATALSADAVKAITAWNDMGADYAQDVTAEDAKTFIYYIRITDKAGNVTYISTADATYDLTKPAISGITNGSTYYTTQKVTVTDTNLDSVTLNGDAVTGELYASCQLPNAKGVGDNDTKAYLNAIKAINANSSAVVECINEGKRKIIDTRGNKMLVNLLLSVFMPASLFAAFPAEYSQETSSLFVSGLIAGFIVMFALIVLECVDNVYFLKLTN